MSVACHLPEDDDQPQNPQVRPDELDNKVRMADPLLRPLPGTPASSILQRSNLGHVTVAEPEDTVRPCRRANSDAPKRSFSKLNEKEFEKPRKHRPLSWLPPSGETSGRASHPPNNSTTSSFSRGVISAPVLTSTTNAKVALTEGLQCGKITTSGLAAPSWHPEPGWVAAVDGKDSARDQAAKVQEQQFRDAQLLLPSHRSTGLHKMPKQSSKRSASMNALSKVKEALTSRMRQASESQTYRSVFRRDKFVRLGDGCQQQPPVKDKHGRIGIEAHDMGADEFRSPSDHGHVTTKPIQHPGRENPDLLRGGRRPLLIDVDGGAKNGCYYADQEQHAVDFHFEDLETSFARAVEKLDFRIKGDKASLTSLSSLFQSGKTISAPNKTRTEQFGQSLPRAPCPQLPASVGHPAQTLSQHSTSDKLATDQPSMGQCVSCALKCGFDRAKTPAEVNPTPYQMDPIPPGKLDESERAERAERIFSRGHLNPLASHPDLTKFAEQPGPTITDPDVPPTPTPTKPSITSYRARKCEGLIANPLPYS